ncbi:hypothetical protein HNP38_003105 [Chryseobacterium defluvii]|uniref:DUF1579 domain-containing protein n=1 Tax=Chryseobacterium defluvii TaxID=160396 RepID=A0A840KE21_9FLAO|nr:hypothetical protein [Chryseobacterium defluvii]MBB4807789.1 hypothetical protein [Chryseobacterium defluvii]
MLGTWKGKYKYDLKRNAKFNNKEVEFIVEITEFEGENFIGTVRDMDENYGTRGLGTIEGKLNGNNIEFIKQMPVKSISFNNGKKIEFENEKHDPVYYSGTLNSEGSYSGKWKIKGGIGFKRKMFIISFGTKGIWEMSKIK